MALAVSLLCAGPAVAQQVFTPPQGCTGTLTVQYTSCMVTNVWTCDDEPDGMQWVAMFGPDGPSQVRQVDAEFQWLVTYYFNPSGTRRMQTPAPDPESLTELFATGYDTYDFTVVPEGSAPLRYVGFDEITGDTVIDGEPLKTTSFGMTVYDTGGNAIYSLSGNQYASERHRLFFLGESWDPSAPADVTDSAPMEFIYPGEAGFFSPNPLYGCDMMMSSYTPKEFHQ
ncbi:hypothetical protein ROA7023_03489 [Roseisalinus antarcticus]|uniref:Uncharacterized protein n=1 Tax=Roseisalinus antarcticus TaxID=254357 RepID=A0A1Y5TSE9_9RHOB|nr:hypothetical protein ROA7023_03489 [Roseisalinus antarcticus]